MERQRYTLFARALHWAIAPLILGQIVLGFATDSAPRDQAEAWRKLHAEIGLLLAGLMLLRLSWRIARPPPPLPPALRAWIRLLASTVHRLLYLAVLVMLASGMTVWMWLGDRLTLLGLVPVSLPDLSGHDEFWLSVAGYTHEYGAWLLAALITLHVAGALWHEFMLKDRLIRDRML